MTNAVGRWVYGGHRAAGNRTWAHCRFCGRAQNHDCPPATCRLCGSVVCHGAGPDCPVCHYGFIPGWSRQPSERECGRKHCTAEAVAKAPRVRRVCTEHAKVTPLRLYGGRTLTLAEYVAQRITHRDSGKGWEHFTFAQ